MTTALIIEDNENNLELIRFILELGVYQTRFAMTGFEGGKQFLSDSPDDIQLQDINGMEVLKRIRAHLAAEHIPIIAMTSYAMSGDRHSLLAAGCSGDIEKPIDPMLVISQIQQVLAEVNVS